MKYQLQHLLSLVLIFVTSLAQADDLAPNLYQIKNPVTQEEYQRKKDEYYRDGNLYEDKEVAQRFEKIWNAYKRFFPKAMSYAPRPVVLKTDRRGDSANAHTAEGTLIYIGADSVASDAIMAHEIAHYVLGHTGTRKLISVNTGSSQHDQQILKFGDSVFLFDGMGQERYWNATDPTGENSFVLLFLRNLTDPSGCLAKAFEIKNSYMSNLPVDTHTGKPILTPLQEQAINSGTSSYRKALLACEQSGVDFTAALERFNKYDSLVGSPNFQSIPTMLQRYFAFNDMYAYRTADYIKSNGLNLKFDYYTTEFQADQLAAFLLKKMGMTDNQILHNDWLDGIDPDEMIQYVRKNGKPKQYYINLYGTSAYRVYHVDQALKGNLPFAIE